MQKRKTKVSPGVDPKIAVSQNSSEYNSTRELAIANKELALRNIEKEKRAAELLVANLELAYQNEEKEKRAAELILLNEELAYQNREKEKRAAELITANQELVHQNKEKEKRATELIVANRKLKRDRHQMQVMNKRLSFHLENTPLAFIEYASEMGITAWSKQAEAIFGWSKKEVTALHKSGYSLVYADDVSRVKNIIAELTSGRKISNKSRYRSYTKSGKVIWCESFNAALQDNKGSVVTIMSLVQDVTESKNEEEESRKKLEMLVEERTSELNEALKKEKGLVELKSRFIAIASHEFRTPLSTISFAAESIRNYFHKLTAAEIKRKLIKIEDQTSHMINLLEDVLTVGKSEVGKVKIIRISLDLKEFMELLIEETSVNAKQERSIEFVYRCASRMICNDDKLLRNICTNLITNALKFSGPDTTVRIVVSDVPGAIQIEVTDEGIGIDRAEWSEIFEPFQRGSNASTVPGTGLGLSILKKAVDLMQGTVSVESVLGKGSTFTVTIPNQ